MQVLTVNKVKKAARKYYKARKLTAQARNPKNRKCEYEVGTMRCAIGSALTQKTIDKIFEGGHENTIVCALWTLGIVDVDADECAQLEVIQDAHDQWAKESALSGAKSPVTIVFRNNFKALIGL